MDGVFDWNHIDEIKLLLHLPPCETSGELVLTWRHFLRRIFRHSPNADIHLILHGYLTTQESPFLSRKRNRDHVPPHLPGGAYLQPFSRDIPLDRARHDDRVGAQALAGHSPGLTHHQQAPHGDIALDSAFAAPPAT